MERKSLDSADLTEDIGFFGLSGISVHYYAGMCCLFLTLFVSFFNLSLVSVLSISSRMAYLSVG